MLMDNPACSNDKAREYLQIIEGETERLKRLIDNVLDFTKIEKNIQTYKKSHVRLNNLVNEVAEAMRYQFEMARISLMVNLEERELEIIADKDAIEQALINLLSNAIRYSEKNTTVEIITGIQNGYVCIKVSDNGIGIDKESIDKIFEPFYRCADDIKKAKGTGLGLSIVKHIVDSHNGKIEVKSKPGKGSEFTLLFPMGGMK